MSILGCALDPVDPDAATAMILKYARERRGAQVVTLGTEMVVYAQRDARYRDVINACTLSLCDTVGLLSVARKRGAALGERVTGVELIDRLCEQGAREGIAFYLLGGAPGVAQQAAEALQQRYNGLHIAGTHDGYFADSESANIAANIRESGAQVLFAGLGFPRQEFWIADRLRETGCGAGIGVGGSFDVICGNVRRAPRRWRKLGLEWLYRLLSEPRRWRRQLALPQFVALVAREQLRLRFARHKT